LGCKLYAQYNTTSSLPFPLLLSFTLEIHPNYNNSKNFYVYDEQNRLHAIHTEGVSTYFHYTSDSNPQLPTIVFNSLHSLERDSRIWDNTTTALNYTFNSHGQVTSIMFTTNSSYDTSLPRWPFGSLNPGLGETTTGETYSQNASLKLEYTGGLVTRVLVVRVEGLLIEDSTYEYDDQQRFSRGTHNLTATGLGSKITNTTQQYDPSTGAIKSVAQSFAAEYSDSFATCSYTFQ